MLAMGLAGRISVQVLDTPSGRLVQRLYQQGCKLGVSSRGWASLRDVPGQQCKCIMQNFELITFDFVTEPSTKGAWLLPYAGRYSAAVPSQKVAEAVSRLGVGAVALSEVARLPPVRYLQAGLAEFQRSLRVRTLRPSVLPLITLLPCDAAMLPQLLLAPTVEQLLAELPEKKSKTRTRI